MFYQIARRANKKRKTFSSVEETLYTRANYIRDSSRKADFVIREIVKTFDEGEGGLHASRFTAPVPGS